MDKKNVRKTDFLISLQKETLQKMLTFLSMATLSSDEEDVDWDRFWKEFHKKQATASKMKNIFNEKRKQFNLSN